MMRTNGSQWVWAIALLAVALLTSGCVGSNVEEMPRDLFSYCIRFSTTSSEEAENTATKSETISYCFQFSVFRGDDLAQLQGVRGTAAPGSGALGEVFPVDPYFIDFYQFLGGEKTLGPAITPLIEAGEVKRQYVQAGLMEYVPEANESDRYRLAPLGLEFNVEEPPVPESTPVEGRYISGHLIPPEFIPLYEGMGGARFVGRPLTSARHNPEKSRIEQYFENLGFYRLDKDPIGLVRLLAYGAFACDPSCRYQAPQASILGLEAPLPQPFASRVASMGSPFLGRILTPPYIASDGKQEVIFENLVLYADPEHPEGVSARPIVELLGIERQPPVDCMDDPLMSCYVLEGDRGHNVPVYFREYLSHYGWLAISGLPITEVFVEGEGLYRQCFTNLCLDFNVNSPENARLRLAPLGQKYQEYYYQPPESDSFYKTQSLENVRIEVWEGATYIAADESQEIHVALFQGDVPLANREPVLTVTMPDGRQVEYTFPPTGDNGMTSLMLPPIPAPNGTLIAYTVCLKGIGEEDRCELDHYLIWNYP